MTTFAVILTRDQVEMTVNAVESLVRQVDAVFVVDNGSSTESYAELSARALPIGFELITTGDPVGYAEGNNRGIQSALARGAAYVLIMNNDAVASPGMIATLLDHLETHPGVGAVAPTELPLHGTIVAQTACFVDERSGRTWGGDRGTEVGSLAPEPVETEYVTGACFMARREALEECGLFDTRYEYYFEDVEWSVRARRRGWTLHVLPTVTFRHLRSASGNPAFRSYFISRNRPYFVRHVAQVNRVTAAYRTASFVVRVVAANAKRRQWGAALAALCGWTVGTFLKPLEEQA